MARNKDFDSDENILLCNFDNELTNKQDEFLSIIKKNRNPISLNKYYEIFLIVLLYLSFQNLVLFANEQNSLLSDEDKQILKSDNKEEIIEYLKETLHPYQIDFKQRTSRNRQKFIELNSLASKDNSINVRIAAFTNLSILGYKEHIPEVLSELQNSFKEENITYQSDFLNIIALCSRNVKIDLKEEIEKAPAGEYRDSLLNLAMNEDIADNISSDIFYDTIVSNMNSPNTYGIAQTCIYVLSERNYEKINSLIEAFEKSNIQARIKGKKNLIYPLRRSANLARRTLEFSAAKNKDKAVKKFLKSLDIKFFGDSADRMMLYCCLRFIQKNNLTNLLPTLKKMEKSIWISKSLKDNIHSTIYYLENPDSYEKARYRKQVIDEP